MPSPIKRTTTATSHLCKTIAIASLAAAALIAAPPTTMADDDGGIRLITQNMDEGTDFIELIKASGGRVGVERRRVVAPQLSETDGRVDGAGRSWPNELPPA